MNNKGGFNPKAVQFRSEKALIFGEKIMTIGSSLATSLAVLVSVYIAAYGFIGEIRLFGVDIGNVISIIVSVAAAALAGWATDFAFGDFLKECIFQLLQFMSLKWIGGKSGNANLPWFNRFFINPIMFLIKLTIVIVLGYFDYSCIKTTDTPVQSFAKQEKEVDMAKELERLKASVSNPEISQKITSLELNIENTERNAVSQNPALKKLADDGNKWGKNKLYGIVNAKTRADKKLKKDLEKTLSENMKVTTSIIEEQGHSLSEKNKGIRLENEAKKLAVSNIYKFIGIGMKFLSILFSTALVVAFMQKHPNYDANNDGVVDSQDVNPSFQ
jgi:hypothetical protein